LITPSAQQKYLLQYQMLDVDGDISASPLPEVALLAAIIKRAVLDARGKTGKAKSTAHHRQIVEESRQWLRSDVCYEFCCVVNLSWNDLQEWLETL
jgi:hypothetical protein